MNLMALCETHIRLIRSIKFRLNKQKMETSLRLLTANVIKKISYLYLLTILIEPLLNSFFVILS
jgi:hypothetical protein